MSRTLDDWAALLAERMEDAVTHGTREEEFRLAVHETIARAGHELFGISEWPDAERQPGADSRRAYDNLYGGAVVEWEWEMGDARREHGAQQALDYLALVREQAGTDESFTAVVCDGQQWGFLTIDPAEPVTLFDDPPDAAVDHFIWEPHTMEASRRFLQLVGTHRQQPITATNLRREYGPGSEHARRLVVLLLETLAGREEGSRADVLYREWRRALDVVYGDLDEQGGDLADVLAEVYGLRIDRPVGEHLFVLHTYFALVARLIAVEVLAIAVEDLAWRPSSWVAAPLTELLQRITDLEEGRLPGGLDITNLFEADVFSWWSPSIEGNSDLQAALLDILDALSRFAFPRAVHGPQVAADVLSDLYQSIVPRQLRRRLGEYLTPQWLAEACLERLDEHGADFANGRTLDATCGTGTFLIPVLNRKLAGLRGTDATTEDVQRILDQVVGIDINPVSVIACRVNFVVALGALSGAGELTLRVWRADSLLVPDSPPRQGSTDDGRLVGHEFRELRTSLPQPFPVPPLLTTAERMDALCRLVAGAVDEPDRDSGREMLRSGLTARFGPGGDDPATTDDERWTNELVVADELYKRIRDLQDRGQNGVWAQIVANAYAPLFAGTFDTIVGNPPWLAWGRLPEVWRRGSERLWRRYGLWQLPPEPGDTGGVFQVSDLATLVFAVAVERYAHDGSHIGLLTPEALLIANPGGRAFRRFRLISEDDLEQRGERVDVPFAVDHVDNWSDVNPFAPLAANNPVFIVARRGTATKYPVSAVLWERATRGIQIGGHWANVARNLRPVPGEYTPAHPEVPTSSWSFRPEGAGPMLEGASNPWEFGKGLDTRGANGIYFVDVVRSIPSQGRVEIQNDPSRGRKSEIRQRRGQVEADVVYPLLRGQDVKRWHAKPSWYCIAPHDPDNFGQPLPPEALGEGGAFRLAGRWLRQHRDVLVSRKTPPTRNWNMNPAKSSDWCRLDGPLGHMRDGPLVVVPEITATPTAAVVIEQFDERLDRTTLPLVDHKLLFCAIDSYDEAVYLAAFINSTPAQDFLTSFASTTGVSPKALATLPIPPFDPNLDDITVLVDHGRAVLEADPGEGREAEADARRGDMDRAVLRLGNIDPATYTPQPKRVRRVPKPPPENQPRMFDPDS